MLHTEIGFLTKAFFNISPEGADAASDQSHNRRSVVRLASSWPLLGLIGWMWTFKSKPHMRTQSGMKVGKERHTHTQSWETVRTCKRELQLFIIKTLCHTQDVWIWAARHSWESHKQTTQAEPELGWERATPHTVSFSAQQSAGENTWKVQTEPSLTFSLAAKSRPPRCKDTNDLIQDKHIAGQ